MPVESRGKGLTTFLLINTISKTVVNPDLEQTIGTTISEMHMQDNDGIAFLEIYNPAQEKFLIKLVK